MFCDLFYDKYAQNHYPNNPLTIPTNVEDLSDGSYELFVGSDAMTFWQRKFASGDNNNHIVNRHMLPSIVVENENLLLKIYRKEINDVEHIYTVVRVNVEILENVPDNLLSFLKKLCIYHHTYDIMKSENISEYYKNPKTINEKLKTNIEYIHTKAGECIDYTNDNRIEQPEFINDSIKLHEYQKCDVHWMINKENNITCIQYNLNEEVNIGSMYYDIDAQQFNHTKDKKKLILYGGGNINQVGLGKTIEMITLGLLKKSTIQIPTIEDTNYLKSKATLVICPNQLVNQWKREFANMIKSSHPVNLVTILTKRDFDKYTYGDILNADFVIISFTFFDNSNFAHMWSKGVSTVKSFNRSEWSEYNKKSVTQYFDKLRSKLIKDVTKTLSTPMPLFQLIKWHRLVVDEFHEVYSCKKYNYVKNLLPHFKADFRWCVSATPFLDTECLPNIIRFLSGYSLPDEDYDKMLLIDDINDYMAEHCFRRNTKKSIEEIENFRLPGLEEEVVWLNFSVTERMMYNAYLVNKNRTPGDVYLRQLCCHPQLANETKLALNNCKNLSDIESMMVSHYKRDMELAKYMVDKLNVKIENIKLKIKIIEHKRLKARLTELGVIFKYNKDKEEDDDVIDEEELKEVEEVMNNLDKYKITPEKLVLKQTLQLETLNESLNKNTQKYRLAVKEHEGKTASYNFFSSVIDKLRNNIKKASDIKEEKQIVDTGSVMDMYNNIDLDEEEEDQTVEKCAICTEDINETCTGVTSCGHIFCYTCIKDSVSKFGNCPYCKQKIGLNQVYTLAYEKPKKVLTEQDLEKEELINRYGTKIANLIVFLRNTNQKCILFSQWDDMLRRTGHILDENKIKNLFCKGNCYQRDKAIREFNSNPNIKAIMLSSESAASGTNLTTATHIIFLDPIYGEYKTRKDQERQAVGRAYRMGQKNVVKVIRFIVKETIEDEIYKMNVEEDKKYANSTEYNSLIETEITL